MEMMVCKCMRCWLAIMNELGALDFDRWECNFIVIWREKGEVPVISDRLAPTLFWLRRKLLDVSLRYNFEDLHLGLFYGLLRGEKENKEYKEGGKISKKENNKWKENNKEWMGGKSLESRKEKLNIIIYHKSNRFTSISCSLVQLAELITETNLNCLQNLFLSLMLSYSKLYYVMQDLQYYNSLLWNTL